MSDAVLIALMGLIGTVTSILVSAFVYLRLGRVATKIDGRMTNLLDAVESKAVAQIGQAHAEGVLVGTAAEQSRTAEPQK